MVALPGPSSWQKGPKISKQFFESKIQKQENQQKKQKNEETKITRNKKRMRHGIHKKNVGQNANKESPESH